MSSEYNLIDYKTSKRKSTERNDKRARGECVKCPNKGCSATYMSKNFHYRKLVKACEC